MNQKHPPITPTKSMLNAGEMTMTSIPPHPQQELQDIWKAMYEAWKKEQK